MTLAAAHCCPGQLPGSWQDRSTATVLVCDPDPDAHRALADVCDAKRFALVSCSDGASALFQAGRVQPHAIVLSALLPVVSAPDVITAIRLHSDTPIALGVGPGEAERAVAGVTAGATAVLSRPYRPRELQSLLGRLDSGRGRSADDAVLTLGALELDVPAHRVRAAGKSLPLTRREFQLLRVLMLNADRVVRSDQIREGAWGGEMASANTIAVHVRRLRARLGHAGDIVNVRGVGYRLAVATDVQVGTNDGLGSVPAFLEAT